MIHKLRGTLRSAHPGTLRGSHATLQQLLLAGGAAAWAPTDLANLEVWFDFSDISTMFTDAGSTPVASDGDLIYQINDKSGNGKNAVQATEANRPAYKTNIQNALSMGLGDGSNDHLAHTDLACSGDHYVLMVIKNPDPLVNWKPFYCQSNSNSNDYIRHEQNGNVTYISANSSAKTLGSQGIISAGAVHLIEVRRSSNDMKIWVDGSDVTNGTVTDDGSEFGPGSLFGVGSFSGYIGELLVYSAALSGDYLSTLRAWANAKWSVY